MPQVSLISDVAMRNIVAHLPEVHAEVMAKANEVGAIARGRLAGHRDTGDAKIEVEAGDIDGYVILDDPAAMSIEFDHLHNFSGNLVGGLHIITGAAGLL